MTQPRTLPIKRVVIVGGGIAGLSTAFALLEEAKALGEPVQCTVLEAQPKWGGKIYTTRVEGLIVEGGPDSFLSIKPWGLGLVEKLGLSSQLINTNQGQSKTFAYSRGQLREFPQGLVSMVPTKMGPLFKSGLVSWAGIVRMAGDWFIPARQAGDPEESLASFFSRRFGQEAFDRLIEPLVAGIYAGDASELSVSATFPQFVDLEVKHGGLIKGALAQQKARQASPQKSFAPRSLFVTLQGGLSDLVARLVEVLRNEGVTLSSGKTVEHVNRVEGSDGTGRWKVQLADGELIEVDGVVLATPAYISSRLLEAFHPEIASLLAQIPYASTVTVSLAFLKTAVQSHLNGFGFVVPRVENRKLIAATWSSQKWVGRANSNESLIRCYIGGRGREAILDLDDGRLVDVILNELRDMVGIEAKPLSAHVFRWAQAMPQYVIGHRDRVKAIRQRLTAYQGLYVTGAAYEGLGIPDCIRDGGETAKALSALLWKTAS
jgi:oxygen-dependent protoporphyrinogen oxidase